MSRYTQDNVPEEIMNRFPTIRSRPSSLSRHQASNSQQENTQTPQKKVEESSHEHINNSVSKCLDKEQLLEEIRKKFPQFNSIKKQSLIERPYAVVPIQQSLLISQIQVKPLHKEFAPDTLPLKDQIAINKATCSLCPSHKKTQSGLLNDFPISHQSPLKN